MPSARQPSNIWELPELPGYITVARAAQLFGMTKEGVFYMIYTLKRFKHVYRLGSPEETKRPMLLLLESEVQQIIAQDKATAGNAELAYAVQVNAWNKRVKQWGAQNWPDHKIHVNGPPNTALAAAYLEANPDDPGPDAA